MKITVLLETKDVSFNLNDSFERGEMIRLIDDIEYQLFYENEKGELNWNNPEYTNISICLDNKVWENNKNICEVQKEFDDIRKFIKNRDKKSLIEFNSKYHNLLFI